MNGHYNNGYYITYNANALRWAHNMGYYVGNITDLYPDNRTAQKKCYYDFDDDSDDDYDYWQEKRREALIKKRAEEERQRRIKAQAEIAKKDEQIEKMAKELNAIKMEEIKNEPEETEPKCRICSENPIEYIITPCYHAVLCGKCKDEYTKNECPKCRGNIKKFKKFST